MAVQRIEWQCPGCGKKYAIPAQNPRPKLCPNCKKRGVAPSSGQPAEPTFPAANAIPPVEPPEPEPEPGPPFVAAPVVPGPPTRSARPVKRRYEVLRTISLWFKVLAVLIGIGYVITLFGVAYLAFRAPAGPMRNQFFLWWVVTSIVGITVVLSVYSFAILLLVAMDIEHNTRTD